MFRIPTPRIFSGLASMLRPAMPRFKVSVAWLLALAWVALLVWIWWKGPAWRLFGEYWLKPLANRWLATTVWGLLALIWLTVRVAKRLQLMEKQQKQQRQEEQDPLAVEVNRQQRYLDRWLLRLQRHLDSRRYLWQLPWYMVIGPVGSGKTALLREGFSADVIYTPDAGRGGGTAGLYHAARRQAGGYFRYRWRVDGVGREPFIAPSSVGALAGVVVAKTLAPAP